MKKKNFINKFLFIMAGIGIILSFFLLTGANTVSPVGRYQLQVTMNRNFPELFVIDTSTGRVKWVGSGDENKPFDEIKSKF